MIDDNKPIVQYGINGKLIRKFRNVKDASTVTNIKQSAILQACKKTDRIAGGYKWSFVLKEIDNQGFYEDTSRIKLGGMNL